MKALIFDVDGTMADTERDGHLPACNQAFARLDIPIQWTWDEFKTMLPIGSNAQRMRLALQKLPQPPVELDSVVANLVKLKQQFYIEQFVPHLPLRAGVRRLIHEAAGRNIRLAIVSSSDEPQIYALLRYRLPEFETCFDPVLGKLVGPKTAPDSPLYRHCLELLGASPAETLVIEDSEVGFRAAQTAGLPCAVIYNDYTYGQNFTGAALVARSLEYFDLDRLAALCLPDNGS
ncbi:MAG: HAD-IA family hydrolase [Anaerolineales bacterium]|nr:HAD-IA family hydrolase [Anaerolineales bacterium]